VAHILRSTGEREKWLEMTVPACECKEKPHLPMSFGRLNAAALSGGALARNASRTRSRNWA